MPEGVFFVSAVLLVRHYALSKAERPRPQSCGPVLMAI